MELLDEAQQLLRGTSEEAAPRLTGGCTSVVRSTTSTCTWAAKFITNDG